MFLAGWVFSLGLLAVVHCGARPGWFTVHNGSFGVACTLVTV